MSATQAPVEKPEGGKALKASAGGGVGDPRTLLIVRTIVVTIVLVWLVPAVGLLLTSFRSRSNIDSSGWWTIFTNPIDYGWTLTNYTEVLTANGFDTAFINTVVVSVPATIIPITIAAFAAYAFSWMEFKGRTTLFIVVVALLVVPLHVALIPILRLYGGSLAIPFTDLSLVVPIDLNRTFLGIWLAHTGFGLPLAIYLLRNYIGSLPSELIESARIDGADHFAIFTRLITPLSVPALASFAIFQFLWVFNDFLVAFVFLGNQRDDSVLTIALQRLNGAQGESWHLLTSAAFISMILPMVVFFSLQRYFVRGMTAGAVKG